ncbi:hypothetical protein L3Q82_002783 [Scortum barcoo]|uniref:Uncharacterized protein n=1 Tax=Scortum barcoo TaxID=214431 RepID=A0ACB8VU74_9TELE|nr:hypothetical protein L3Q82_002783 [Scortum barcoo]
MNEKKVENMHTKPRGKGQCSPEQTCPEGKLGYLVEEEVEERTHPYPEPDTSLLKNKCDQNPPWTPPQAQPLRAYEDLYQPLGLSSAGHFLTSRRYPRPLP